MAQRRDTRGRSGPGAVGVLVTTGVAAVFLLLAVFNGNIAAAPVDPPSTTATSTDATQPSASTTEAGPSTIGRPWGALAGIGMFRGNPTRSWFGTGPVPDDPGVLWSYPDDEMCSRSSDLGHDLEWCGTGWTGQPLVWARDDAITEVIFGSYDGAVHFVDADTGRATREPFVTGDLVKGTDTLDPDGFPLLYVGSRDAKFRILALDRDPVEELWSMDAHDVDGLWNEDWDASPVIVDGILYQGGENGWFYAIELNRALGDVGLVEVEPEILVAMPTYDDDFLSMLNGEKPMPAYERLPKDGSGFADYDINVSIESSLVVFEDRVYLGTSAGRILGLDISRVREGVAPVTFDYWAAGNIVATMTVDDEGMLYAAIGFEPNIRGGKPRYSPDRANRQRQIGQLIKLDPQADGDPRVWGFDATAGGNNAGFWASPVLHGGIVYAPTHTGELVALDAETGEVIWRDSVGYKTWSSPVIIDDVLIQATFDAGIRAYSLENPRRPERLWTVELPDGGEVEATPVVWKGEIYVGSRDGFFYAIGNQR